MTEPSGYGANLGEFMKGFHANGKYKEVEIETSGGRRAGDLIAAFERIRDELIDQLVANLERRFPQLELIDAMKVCYWKL